MIEQLAAETKGWLHPAEGPALRRYAAECEGPYLELGTYCGKSTLWIGAAARTNGTVLFTVDHHRGSPEMAAGNNCHDPDVLDEHGRHDTLPHLRATLAAADLEEHVVPIVGRSQTVGAHWKTPVGFLFIDAGHDEKSVVADYELFSPWCTGVLAFHDVATEASAAVDAAVSDGWGHVETIDGCLGIYRR